ncbi:hypothetical protein FH5_04939 [Priestia endophytica]|nr:hypothetical protein FH5_04939 [Priestia endophytica]
MFKAGIRINTLVQHEENYIDFQHNLLNLEGSIMKNHQQIKLMFDELLAKLFKLLDKGRVLL